MLPIFKIFNGGQLLEEITVAQFLNHSNSILTSSPFYYAFYEIR